MGQNARMSDERVIDTVRRLSAALKPGELDDTLRQITDAAVRILPDVEHASISILHEDGSIGSSAETSELVKEVDARQYELQEGPCFQAATEESHVVSSNLASDERFPAYGKAAVDAGLRSQAGIRLFDSRKARGALNLYSSKVGVFEDLSMVNELFASQAALALAYAAEVSDLRRAMQTRETIGKAVGIVMERYKLADDRAFAFLARVSQNRNVKLRQVAEEVIAANESGTGM
jgi:GAF domain-containing protein